MGLFFWAFIGEKIINNDEKPSNDDTNLYSMEIAIKIKIYLIIQIIGWLIAYIISFILMYERKNYNTEIQIDIKSEDGDLFSKRTDLDTNTDLGENFLNDNENINYDENIIDSGIVLSNKKYESNFNNNYKEEKLDDNDDDNDSIAKKLSKKRKISNDKNERKKTMKKRRRSSGENEGFKGFFNEDLNLRFESDEFLLTDTKKKWSIKNLKIWKNYRTYLYLALIVLIILIVEFLI